MIQLKAALFDLDGVVFDTEPQYSVFWGSQCRLYHPEQLGLEHIIKGSTLTQIYDRWFSGPLEKEREIITKRLDAFEQQMVFNYINGFEEFVADLRSHGIHTAVVTSSNIPKMESVYRQRPEFKGLFDVILTSEDFAFSKPHPDCYVRGAQRFGATPSECLIFEDSLNGLRSGQAAGSVVVGLATTLSEELIRQYSDVQLKDYQGLNYEKIAEIFACFAEKS